MKTKETRDSAVVKLLSACTTLVQLGIIYLVVTWGYDLVHFVMTTLAKPFMGGA